MGPLTLPLQIFRSNSCNVSFNFGIGCIIRSTMDQGFLQRYLSGEGGYLELEL